VDSPAIVFTPGKGLVVKSKDGDFSLALQWRAQVLFAIENEHTDGAEATQALQIRRARLSLSGNMFGKSNKFKSELALSPRDVSLSDAGVGTSPLLDAYFDFVHLRDLSFRVGQYKVPFSHQRVVSSADLQLVDRAITNAEFNLDRDIGFDFHSEDLFGLDLLRYHLGVYTGEGRNSFADSDFGLSYMVRSEVLPFGLFDDLVEGDFERSGPRLAIGAAYAFIDRAKTDRGILGGAPVDGGTTDFNVVTADATFKVAGFSAMTEFFYRSGERDSGPLLDDTGAPILDADGNPLATAPARDGLGLLLQAGYLVPRIPLEVVGRYAFVRASDDAGHDGLSDEDEVGGGLNYYFAEHSLKLQGDYMRLSNDGDFGTGTDMPVNGIEDQPTGVIFCHFS
jgi:hypothetical protein